MRISFSNPNFNGQIMAVRKNASSAQVGEVEKQIKGYTYPYQENSGQDGLYIYGDKKDDNYNLKKLGEAGYRIEFYDDESKANWPFTEIDTVYQIIPDFFKKH